MRFLTDTDYTNQIKNDNLNQIIEDDLNILYNVELVAIAEISGYLSQRYDVSKIFKPTYKFNYANTYQIDDLVQYSESEFDMSVTYTANQRVCFENKIYLNISDTSIISILPTDTDVWEYVVDNNQLFTCIKESLNKYPNDTEYFIKKDNRNPLIVQSTIDVCLYHLHSRINPRNIPELRIVRYDGNSANGQVGGVIAWLKNVSNGKIVFDGDLLVPDSGSPIQYGTGSNESNKNFY